MLKLSSILQLHLEENFWLAAKTIEGRKRAFRYLIRNISDKLIQHVTREDCEAYKGFLLSENGCCLNRNSANIMLREVNRVLNWAVEVKNLIEENPMSKVKQFKVPQGKINTFEKWQLDRMLEYASPIWKARLYAGRYGLRRGEVLNLTKDNIRKGYIFIEPKKSTTSTWLWEPKDFECRAIPVFKKFQELLSTLTCYYPMISYTQYRNLMSLQDRGLLTEEKRKCPDQNFSRGFRFLQLKAFGKLIGCFHDLRKTFVTASLEAGIPIHIVQSLSGHSNTKTVQKYYTAVRESFIEKQRDILTESIKAG